MCRKRASCVGLTMPAMWAPSLFSKLATSTYLWYFSSPLLRSAPLFCSASSLFPAFVTFLESTGRTGCDRAGSKGCPKRVPMVRYSWAKYPASRWLDESGSAGAAVLSEPACDWVVAGFSNFAGVGESKSSLSLRLVGVKTRRGGRRIVLVFMALLLGACHVSTRAPSKKRK